MQQIFPTPSRALDREQVSEAYAYPPRLTRPWIRFNFVASLDGAATVDGHAGGLGSATDQDLMQILRLACQALVVGAGTIRVEGYTGPLVDPAGYRKRHGQSQPLLVVISGRLDLDPESAFFTEAARRPVLLTTADAKRARGELFAGVADVVAVKGPSVTPRQVADFLARQEITAVLCEGGPHIFGEFVAAGLVDELCLSLSPTLTGPQAPRINTGDEPSPELTRMTLLHTLYEDSMLFLRYENARATAASARLNADRVGRPDIAR